MPFFSIIVPVYNRASLVGETIDSILSQTFTDFELILVDDKSTDNSFEVLQSYAQKDKRIVVLTYPENQGRCAARNTGLDAAAGTWVCYLDSDDWYYPNHLSTFNELIAEYPEQKAFASEQTFGKKAKEYNQERFKNDLVALGIEDFIRSNPISANQLCYHKSIDVRWSEENIPISEDWLFHRLLSIQTAILKKNIVTTDVRMHDERSINVIDVEHFVKWNLYAANKFVASNQGDSSKYNANILSYIKILTGNIFINNGFKWKGLKLLLESLLSLSSFKNPLLYKGFVKLFVPSKYLN
jgi:glycosyltransferase involved in cell wall biosynthesis